VNERKNIDRLFQENLKDFEVYPPNKAWNNIEKQLVVAPRRRRYPVWVKFASIAALFLLLFSVSTVYFIPSDNITNTVPPQNTNTEIEEVKTSQIETDLIKISNPAESQLPTTVTTELKNTEINTDLSEENPQDFFENTNEIIGLSEESVVAKNNILIDAPSEPFLGETDSEVSIEEAQTPKITIGTIIAPIYMNSFGDGSGIDSQFKDNNTSGGSSYSYGVKLVYKLNNKFSLQSGVNLINLGYKTNDVYITPGGSVLGLSNVSSSPAAARNNGIATSKNDVLSSFNEDIGSLNQVFGYIEIPVELKYNLSNGKFGVNLVGGFSTLVLNKNEIFVLTDDFTQSLGASDNLRSVNFTGNFGVDLDYLLRKNLYFNVSPMFKMHTNTFSKNSGSLQPYYLGIYTGLNYKF
jgi:hypothetical protein